MESDKQIRLTRLARSIDEIQATVDQMRRNFLTELYPHIEAWSEANPPRCGGSGGWTYGSLSDGFVTLKHECIWEHRSRYLDVLFIDVPLATLLEA